MTEQQAEDCAVSRSLRRIAKGSRLNVFDVPILEDAADLVDGYRGLRQALVALVVDANRLCDRNLGGTDEDDCRISIAAARTAIVKAEGR